MTALDARVAHWHGELTRHAPGYFSVDDLRAAVGVVEEGVAPEVIDARVQRALLGAVKSRLDAQPAENRLFPKSTGWKVLDQLLTVARLKELTRVKIVKRGRSGGLRYDTSELADTFYGRHVMEGLGFGKRRRVLEKAEFERVRAEFRKIKLELPEAVEPTTTERFFAGDDD